MLITLCQCAFCNPLPHSLIYISKNTSESFPYILYLCDSSRASRKAGSALLFSSSPSTFCSSVFYKLTVYFLCSFSVVLSNIFCILLQAKVCFLFLLENGLRCVTAVFISRLYQIKQHIRPIVLSLEPHGHHSFISQLLHFSVCTHICVFQYVIKA